MACSGKSVLPRQSTFNNKTRPKQKTCDFTNLPTSDWISSSNKIYGFRFYATFFVGCCNSFCCKLKVVTAHFNLALVGRQLSYRSVFVRRFFHVAKGFFSLRVYTLKVYSNQSWQRWHEELIQKRSRLGGGSEAKDPGWAELSYRVRWSCRPGKP